MKILTKEKEPKNGTKDCQKQTRKSILSEKAEILKEHTAVKIEKSRTTK